MGVLAFLDDDSISPSADPFERLFRQEYPHLHSYGKSLTPRTSVVEDAIQEVFMALWRSETTVEELDHPRSYLFTALRREIIAHLKTERDRREKRAEQVAPPVDFALPYEDLIIAHEQQTEQQAKVESALQSLSKRRREALSLRFRHGLTHREVADVMDVAYQTARNYVSEALLHIRSHLKAVDAP